MASKDQLNVPEQDRKDESEEAHQSNSANSQASTRSTSPRSSTSKMDHKFRSQFNRMQLFTDMYAEQKRDFEQLTETEIDIRLSLFTEAYEGFCETHRFIEENSPASLSSHPYFRDGVFNQMFGLYSRIKFLLAKAKGQLNAKTTQSSDPSYAQALTPTRRKLPEISLPTFTGDYSGWMPFRDMFNSMVIQNQEISNVEKMHYLKSSLSGQAAQLISNVPIADNSFDAAWATLNDRFENKRLLIAAQLDKLLEHRPLPTRSAQALNALLTKVNDAMHALISLDIDVKHLDIVIVHAITKVLDSTTREQWEVRLGSSTHYPKLEQLIEFLTARARALERLETTPSTSTKPTPRQPTQQRAVSTHHTSQASSSKSTATVPFPCDHCKGDHYIVTCSQFRQLTPAARLSVVNQHRLCFNCLGHHNARMCQSKVLCKLCGARHHTMIHSNRSTSSDSSTSTQTSTSANSQA